MCTFYYRVIFFTYSESLFNFKPNNVGNVCWLTRWSEHCLETCRWVLRLTTLVNILEMVSTLLTFRFRIFYFCLEFLACVRASRYAEVSSASIKGITPSDVDIGSKYDTPSLLMSYQPERSGHLAGVTFVALVIGRLIMLSKPSFLRHLRNFVVGGLYHNPITRPFFKVSLKRMKYQYLCQFIYSGQHPISTLLNCNCILYSGTVCSAVCFGIWVL